MQVKEILSKVIGSVTAPAKRGVKLKSTWVSESVAARTLSVIPSISTQALKIAHLGPLQVTPAKFFSGTVSSGKNAFRAPIYDRPPTGNDFVLVLHTGYAAHRVMSALRRAYGTNIKIIQMSHEDEQQDPLSDYKIGLKGDRVACYRDHDQILAKIQRWNDEEGVMLGRIAAVDPAWGYDSENPDLARKMEEAGIVWSGPTSTAMAAAASKVALKKAAVDLGLPVTPFEEMITPDEDAASINLDDKVGRLVSFIEAHRDGDSEYIFFMKVPSGGGGKGIARIVVPEGQSLDDAKFRKFLKEKLERVIGEGITGSGESTVFVEESAGLGSTSGIKHIEWQLFGSSVVGVRDCSLQDSGHQKFLEIAPIPPGTIPEEVQVEIRTGVSRLAEKLDYKNVGTFETLVWQMPDDSWRWTVLEMNTRKQVEHPITEETTFIVTPEGDVNLNIPALALEVAYGMDTPKPSDLTTKGYAIQARISTRRPMPEGWTPIMGDVQSPRIAADTKTMIPVGPGNEFGDSQRGAMIVTAPTYEEALDRLKTAIHTSTLPGFPSVLPTLEALLSDDSVRTGWFNTRTIPDSNQHIRRITHEDRAGVIASTVLGPMSHILVNGFGWPGANPERTWPGNSVFARAAGMVAGINARPLVMSPVMKAFWSGGWSAAVSVMKTSPQRPIKLDLRDVAQSGLSSSFTPELWASMKGIIERTGAADIVETPSGAALQYMARFAQMNPIDGAAAALSKYYFSTGLSRTTFQWGLQEMAPDTRRFVLQVLAKVARRSLGLAPDVTVPFGIYDFHAGNLPELIAASVQMTCEEGLIGIPTVCLTIGQDPSLTYEVAKAIFELLPSEAHLDIAYLKNPTGFKIRAPQIQEHYAALRVAYKEVTGRDLVVMYHAHNQAENATINAEDLYAMDGTDHLIAGVSPQGFRTHADWQSVAVAGGEGPERMAAISQAELAIQALLETRNRFNTVESKLPLRTTMPGGMRPSAISDIVTAGLDPNDLQSIYDLGEAVLGARVSVTPYSQRNMAAGITLWKLGHRSESDVEVYLRAGKEIPFPDDVIGFVFNWPSKYPKTRFTDLIKANHRGPIPEPKTPVSFDPEEVRVKLAEEVGLDPSVILDSEVATYFMYGDDALPIIQNRVTGQLHSIVPDRVLFGEQLKPGDKVRVSYNGLKQTVTLVSMSTPNDTGNVHIVWEIDGGLVQRKNVANVAMQAKLSASSAVSVRKAEASNPGHIGALSKGKVIQLPKVGDRLAPGDTVVVTEAMKMQSSVKAGEVEGVVAYDVTEVHVEKGASVESEQLVVELKPIRA